MERVSRTTRGASTHTRAQPHTTAHPTPLTTPLLRPSTLWFETHVADIKEVEALDVYDSGHIVRIRLPDGKRREYAFPAGVMRDQFLYQIEGMKQQLGIDPSTAAPPNAPNPPTVPPPTAHHRPPTTDPTQPTPVSDPRSLRRVGSPDGRQPKPLSLRVCSWNMGEYPPPADLSAWLPPGLKDDLVAVGVQECAYEEGKKAGGCEQDFASILHSHFGEAYAQLSAVRNSAQFGAIRRNSLTAPARAPRRSRSSRSVCSSSSAARSARRLQTGTRGTGLGNVYGNKGGAAVAFHFYDTSICPINTHLAAGDERINERNMDFADIVSDLAVGRKALEVSDQFDHISSSEI